VISYHIGYILPPILTEASYFLATLCDI